MSPRILRDLPLPIDAGEAALRRLCAEALGVPEADLGAVRLLRRALDARGRRPPRWVVRVEVFRPGEDPPPRWSPPELAVARRLEEGERPVIVGAGPAGLFAALRLLERGIAPILLERGRRVEERGHDVAHFRRTGVLDPESNACFGEGGAGTFSDGKLYTRKHDRRVRTVLEWLVAFGAPELSTLVETRPHIGTNRLIPICRNLRRSLVEHGVDLRFESAVRELRFEERHGRRVLTALRLASGEEIPARRVILATGHSARGVYAHLAELKVAMEPKSMAIGFRVEHPQDLVDRAQLGRHTGHPRLGPASYRLACQVDGRGVYSFCMCPGGFVIPTPAHLGRLNVNGMSNSNRGSPFANSAIVATVEARDYASGDTGGPPALAGVRLQDRLERACYAAGGGGYLAPAQRIPDLLAGRGGDLPAATSYRPGIRAADLLSILPESLHDPLRTALRSFGRKLRGFDSAQAVAMGVETTTSAPLRVLRDATLQSPTLEGLYPCGEGSGHSGGIVSSAIDGLRVADAVAASMGSSIPPIG